MKKKGQVYPALFYYKITDELLLKNIVQHIIEFWVFKILT